jgi:AcrR family transcriptional regulator
MQVRPSSANRILETALDLFATSGYEKTSVREICAAAGITKPTLYYFYGSKEGVYRALVLGTMEEVRQRIVSDLHGPGPLVARLKALVRWFFEDTMQRRKLWRFIATTVWSPELVDMTEHICAHKDMGNVIVAALDEAVRRGELSPGPTPIRLLVLKGAISEVMDSFLLFGEPALTGELADQLIDTIFTGWLSPASSTAPEPVAAPASSSASRSSASVL